MFKIYIQEIPICLLPKHVETPFVSTEALPSTLIVDYDIHGKSYLYECIEAIEKGSNNFKMLFFKTKDIVKLKEDFWQLYKVLEAAGGVVYNEQDEILAIYRRGHWDLPKGKIDPGETTDQAAIREVEEETGVQGLKLGNFITQTYHTYFNRKGKRVLKSTAWFEMHATNQPLTPQTEEDIEQAVWLPLETLITSKPIYNNIVEVLNTLTKHA